MKERTTRSRNPGSREVSLAQKRKARLTGDILHRFSSAGPENRVSAFVLQLRRLASPAPGRSNHLSGLPIGRKIIHKRIHELGPTPPRPGIHQAPFTQLRRQFAPTLLMPSNHIDSLLKFYFSQVSSMAGTLNVHQEQGIYIH